MNLRFGLAQTIVIASLALGQAALAEAQVGQPLDQGWTAADRHYFYRTTQGSRLIPYQVFLKLERPNSTERLASQTNLSRLGFIYEAPTADNPDNLPIGWVKDSAPGKPDYIGLTCAGCHTRQVTYGAARYTIDGSGTNGDTEKLLQELEFSLVQTLNDSAKFARYRAARGFTTTANDAALNAELGAAFQKMFQENEVNRPAFATAENPTRSNNPGPGRVDAFGHIKNRVAHYVLTPNNTKTPIIDATAPVSIPFLWDAPYLDFVQWPGNSPNWGPGSLARNVGEVLGVFAETTITRDWWGTIKVQSSANIPNLLEIENRLLKLKSPQWPSTLPPINGALAAFGKPLFNQYCGSCHVTVDRLPRTKHIDTFSMGADKVGTDPTMADNNEDDLAPMGLLNPASTVDEMVNPLQHLTTFVLEVAGTEMLNRTVELTLSHKQPVLPPKRNLDVAEGEGSSHTYKARPLNGIWATGPYLHNGSVRTLYQLMLPGAEREKTFCVGSNELVPSDVGFSGACTPGSYLFDSSKLGNSNRGHEYGTPADTRFPVLTELQRRAVVEYMKTL